MPSSPNRYLQIPSDILATGYLPSGRPFHGYPVKITESHITIYGSTGMRGSKYHFYVFPKERVDLYQEFGIEKGGDTNAT